MLSQVATATSMAKARHKKMEGAEEMMKKRTMKEEKKKKERKTVDISNGMRCSFSFPFNLRGGGREKKEARERRKKTNNKRAALFSFIGRTRCTVHRGCFFLQSLLSLSLSSPPHRTVSRLEQVPLGMSKVSPVAHCNRTRSMVNSLDSSICFFFFFFFFFFLRLRFSLPVSLWFRLSLGSATGMLSTQKWRCWWCRSPLSTCSGRVELGKGNQGTKPAMYPVKSNDQGKIKQRLLISEFIYFFESILKTFLMFALSRSK